VIGWTADGRFLAVEGKVLDDLSPQQQGFLDRVRAPAASPWWCTR
jgi:hypothetical protein